MQILKFMASEGWGGAEKATVDLANELSKHHTVTALLLRGTIYKKRFHDRVRLVETRSHPTRNNPFLMLELLRIIKDLQPDIIHTHGAKAALLINRLSYFQRINHLATKHNGRKGRIFNKLNYVSAVSEEARRSVAMNPEKLIRVIHNGIVPGRKTTNLSSDIFRIAAIGRLDKIKGFELLLKQVQLLSFPFHLTIAGEGPEKKSLQQLILDLELCEKVSLVGFSEDIPEMMGSSHVVVLSSHSEGFPQVMVESLFYGNLLISTPVGGVVEVLPEMFLAEQSKLGDKLAHVHENYEEYRERFRRLSAAKRSEFELSAIAAHYQALYREILAKADLPH